MRHIGLQIYMRASNERERERERERDRDRDRDRDRETERDREERERENHAFVKVITPKLQYCITMSKVCPIKLHRFKAQIDCCGELTRSKYGSIIN